MKKIRSVCQAVRDIRESDPDTAMTETFIRRLIHNGEISATTCGSREYIELETLGKELAFLFGLESEVCPKMRTVRTAAKDIKDTDPHSMMTEYKIRMLIRIGRLQSVAVGSRQIIAMESFDDSEIFEKGYLYAKPARSNYSQSVSFSDQFDKVLSETTQRYTCQRRRA